MCCNCLWIYLLSMEFIRTCLFLYGDGSHFLACQRVRVWTGVLHYGVLLSESSQREGSYFLCEKIWLSLSLTPSSIPATPCFLKASRNEHIKLNPLTWPFNRSRWPPYYENYHLLISIIAHSFPDIFQAHAPLECRPPGRKFYLCEHLSQDNRSYCIVCSALTFPHL